MYSGDRSPGSKDTTTEGLDRPRRLQRGGGLANRLDSNRQRPETVEGAGRGRPSQACRGGVGVTQGQ